AGLIWRGIGWFVSLELASIIVALLFIWISVPTWICFAATLLFWSAGLAMLVDSFRPGRLTFPFLLVFLPAAAVTVRFAYAGRLRMSLKYSSMSSGEDLITPATSSRVARSTLGIISSSIN